MTKRYRLGIDIGGTFTDLVLMDEASGETLSFKTASVPSDPAQAVLNGIELLQKEHGIEPGSIGYFVHGTTLGLNTVIQRAGATTGLLVTKGFRDILEIGRLRLSDPTNFYVEKIKPLVARQHVGEIDERIGVDGRVHRPLDLEAAEATVETLIGQGVESLAVCFMHAYRNGAHEVQLAAHIRERFPQLYVSTSSEIWPQQREYERSLVTVINAYIGGQLRGYFDRLHDGMSRIGVKASLLTTKSNGGIMTAHAGAERPVETLLSGPASGAMGALQTGRTAGYDKIVGFDMGGTSVDIAIVDGDVLYSTESQVGDFPVIMPTVDISSIGAGGGSIAWLDPSGVLKVGPRSAGAVPGPAAYGRGGKLPTVTDAYVRIGLYSPGRVLGGGLVLDHDLAEAALATLAEPLGLDTGAVASGILDVTTANMYAQFMPLMARKGIDPREFSLLAYGGAGPGHAFLLAREVGSTRVIVPRSPGTLCALGSLVTDLRRDFIRTVSVDLLHRAPDGLERELAGLKQQAFDWLASQDTTMTDRKVETSADMRYRGQSFDLTVSFDSLDATVLLDGFHAQYQRIYGFSDPKADVEITNLRVAAIGVTGKPKQVVDKDASGKKHVRKANPIRIGTLIEDRKPVAAGFYDRATLVAGDWFEGPAVIEAADTTVYVPAGFTVHVDAWGNLIGEPV
ncbi:hydantoinase/oxoprolinase family protein [Aliirhizobium smilacinae]|uniref:Hydantoinase/oxoprolinase family protein n=1 Tax=Aliirhizobium smilacinae TaxID=1395944 RepID=A0A5C4XJ81_9HYPH|nr:hydantoinase/oxoprolinase family protein [Rhizobium smilacinae]TNM63452.1 hydantoinase/oxoprolinase family protein [Rhizobium smilacinae]